MGTLARLVGVGLLCAVAPAQAAQAPQPPAARFDGRSPPQWADRVREDMKAAIAELAAGGKASLPVLEAMLADRSDTVAEGAARACAAIGPAAAPLLPHLARELTSRGTWITAWHCADAARAIGVGDRAMLAALLTQLQQSSVPALRYQCVLVYGQLQADAPARLLTAATRGEFMEPQFAIDALANLGERAAPTLAERLSTHPDDAIARGAVEAIGWRTVPFLERAGLADAIDSVLRAGPLRHVPWHEHFTVESTGPTPALARLPAITWEVSHGHGGDLELSRAAEDDRGLRVDQIRFLADPTPHVVVRTTTLPRGRAMALGRQLAVLGRMRLALNQGAFVRDWFSSGDFFARVHAAVGAEVLLAATFGGYPTEGNAPQRLQPQAAKAILWEALADATWTERGATADERAAVDARCRESVEQPKWVAERLQQLRALLAPK